jgi:murein DD-endopeptidase MepM/ murein hydrolase activator NlpD
MVAAGFVAARRLPGPTIEIAQPNRFLGREGQLDVQVRSPGGQFTTVTIEIEQNGRAIPLFALDRPESATLTQVQADTIRVTRPLGRRALPDLRAGPARLTVRASRSVLFALLEPTSIVTRELEVRVDPPRLSVVSMHHFVNHGGAELLVYRVAPPDAESGVQVGEVVYPGYPAAGLGVDTTDAGVRVAFFALLYEQDLGTPMVLYARDVAGNEARVPFDHRVFPRVFRTSRIELDDGFLGRVVPAIAAETPAFAGAGDAAGDLLQRFLHINRDLRRLNAERIASLAARTSKTAEWREPFLPFANAAVESSFADQRTYFYKGREVDRQVHYGFDLASTAADEVKAANRGHVVLAEYLGIYGNTVVLDHGLGVQSLYAHLSSIAVKEGDLVERDRPIGRTGATGLAGGDHLHFTMLVQGRPVNAVEWWDPHWIEDRVHRKVREASAGGVPGRAP